MMRRTNPFEDIEELFERLSRQFDEMGHQFDRSGMMPTPRMHDMAVDISDYDDKLVLSADLPGYEKEDISLSIANRTLTIDAKREVTEERGEGEYLRRERRQQSARRTLRLPEMVDEENASASYHNGVLTVELPKMDVTPDDSHRIDID
ncbi:MULTISPECIES: Hsp20/alpha crystallin family protein [Haloferax]|uniref:Hsp20 family protein n=2 Tax=Haloferax TaxID=2251 RepID=A0A6G1YYK8_9EURY|nr:MULTISPECIES: Hsp20/alpha crystallin family protein [Haloferax]KAB1186745.1 Hsp20/alpha crystallin family protein [Haloferax sp. CBA1149]MRW79370.1 Hsp20 family protein [Haloferax marinisediminis]